MAESGRAAGFCRYFVYYSTSAPACLPGSAPKGAKRPPRDGAAAAGVLAERIAGSRLHVYRELGHGAYEEAKDFHARVMRFLEEGERT